MAISPVKEKSADAPFDVVVVGGGAAGISAAKILARSCRSVLVVDAGAPRNAPAHGVHNYLYAEGTPPGQLAEIGRAEAVAYGVELVQGRAMSAIPVEPQDVRGPRFQIEVGAGDGVLRTVSTRRVMLATGLVDVLPDIAGLAERWGRDVLHCPFCHGWEVRGQAIGVIGSGPMAVHQVMLFAQLTDDIVYFQHTAPDPNGEQSEQLAALAVTLVVGQVAAVQTSADELSGVRMADGRFIARRAVAVATRVEARRDLLADLSLTTDELVLGGAALGSYLPVDPSGATARPGVWAAGNLSAPMAQVIGAASAGALAGAAIHMDLIAEDTKAAVVTYRTRQGISV